MRDLELATLAMLAFDRCARRATAGARFLCDRYDHNGSSCAFLFRKGAGCAARPNKAAAVISGCPNLPKDGNILVYRLGFADRLEANLARLATAGGKPSRGSRSHRGPIAGGDRP